MFSRPPNALTVAGGGKPQQVNFKAMEIFTIISTDGEKVYSRLLTAFMVHYLFIEKKWPKDKMLIIEDQFIRSKHGAVTYKDFAKKHPL